MKFKGEMIITELAGEYIAVPVGEASEHFKGVIRLNSTGKDIWDGITEGLDREQIADKMLDLYDGIDNNSILEYIDSFIAQLDEKGLIEK